MPAEIGRPQKTSRMSPGPQLWRRGSQDSQVDRADLLASNAAQRSRSSLSMSSSMTVLTNLSNHLAPKVDSRPTRLADPLHGPKSKLSLSDVRSRTRRQLRVSSRLRVYYDHRQLSTSPVLTIPSPLPKDITLPSFPPPVLSSTSELKYRSRERRPWEPLLYRLNESPSFWLALYFLFNLSLTIYNKSVLIRFPFPYTLTALHALCSAVGSSVMLQSSPANLRGGNQTLSWKEIITLGSFSVLFTFNIAMSNISLKLVTIPFHQVVRATTPLFTMFLSQVLLGSGSTREKLTSLVPVIAGVAFTTYGDYYFSLWGFALTFLGTILAAFKTIVTNVLQSPPATSSGLFGIIFQRLQPLPTLPTLSPLEHLHFLSPLAFIQSLILAHWTGELGTVYHFTRYHLSHLQRIFLLANGILAFGLNVTSFGANKRVGAVSMSVAANVKQVLTMLCAVMIFDLRITPTNALGIALTLAGGGWYTSIELREKKRAKFMRESLPSPFR
ncbi:hypothetical protein APHAL10511_007265 [Amanita phalloides]|nr:hypothetical protein APHAL10511_007265 [Amanita phalloides]